MDAHTPLPWLILGDPTPRQGALEAAPGLTIGSPANTEPIARFSGYCQPVEENVRFTLRAVSDYDRLRARVKELREALQDLLQGVCNMKDGCCYLGNSAVEEARLIRQAEAALAKEDE